ncbi:MAG: cyclodeaminase/cyclohydrolase family protein [Candidatus Brocadiia bacterium]
MEYASATLKQYLTDAASDKPAPGGGSISALAGALASSMSEMAANFTTGKDKYDDVKEDIQDVLQTLEVARQKLLALVDADVKAYGAVNEAYGMPKDTDEQKQERREAIQAALKEAMKVPLNIMRQCRTVSETSADLVGIANQNLLTDVAVSAVLSEAACAAARFNVDVNLKYIKDDSVADEVSPEVEELIDVTKSCRAKVVSTVAEYLSK